MATAGMKKVDPRVSELIHLGVARGHRSMFVLVGDARPRPGRQPALLPLEGARVRAASSVLWCYKKASGFSSHQRKRMKKAKKSAAQRLAGDGGAGDPFELFLQQTSIRWCYYRDTQRVLGATYGCLVLQDFEALTPPCSARARSRRSRAAGS